MTIHVVCLDGTAQVKDQPHPTNIARIFDALSGDPSDGGNGSLETVVGGSPPLSGKYLPGVGTQGSQVLRVLGNGFGDGIAEPIVRGYTYLSRVYAPGDEIVICGFSRGATAARALAGLVVTHGLLDKTHYDVGDKDAAYERAISAWYAYRNGQPDIAYQARLAFMELRLGHPLPRLVAADYAAAPQIKAVAVFDTVSSLGLPHLDAQGEAVFDFSICDTTLSPQVAHGFHALSADESRDLFGPTFWADRAGIEQQAFPGAHSNVGGGYPERGLSDGALAWMLDRLASIGVRTRTAALTPPLAPNSRDIARDDGLVFPFKDTPRRARAFPTCVHPSASLRERLGQLTEILPGDGQKPYRPVGKYADGSLLIGTPPRQAKPD